MTYEEVIQLEKESFNYKIIEKEEEIIGKTIIDIKTYCEAWNWNENRIFIFSDNTAAIFNPTENDWQNHINLINVSFDKNHNKTILFSSEAYRLIKLGIVDEDRLEKAAVAREKYEKEYTKKVISESIDKKLEEIKYLKNQLTQND